MFDKKKFFQFNVFEFYTKLIELTFIFNYRLEYQDFENSNQNPQFEV